MNRKTLLQVALLATSVFTATTLYAQVTIGADQPPVQGALLDLKMDENGNSTRGLGLPRVKLVKLADNDISKTIDGVAANAYPGDHTGMVVYHMASASDDVCKDPFIFPGVYVWDGGQWTSLNQSSPSGMNTMTDERDGETYLVGNFNNAGDWMLENLRYKGGLTISKTGDADNAKTYFYPQPDAGTETNPDNIPTYSNRQGLLYTWAAATNGENTSTADQGQALGTDPGTNEVEKSGPHGTSPNKYVQGICPPGWHLPSDREWNDLEREIYGNSSAYSTIPSNSFSPVSWSATWEYGITSPNPAYGAWRPNMNATGDGHGTALKSTCVMDPNGTAGDPNGKSKPVTEGGFDLMLTGYAEKGKMNIYGSSEGSYGDSGNYWSSSSAADNTQAWRRTFVHDRIGVLRGEVYKRWLLAVRCKKNKD